MYQPSLKEKLKFIVFIELITVIVTSVVNIIQVLRGDGLQLVVYPIMMMITLITFVAVIWVFTPLFEWFMGE